jgi:hypothetical protein
MDQQALSSEAISRLSAFLADPLHRPAHKPFAALLSVVQIFVDDPERRDDSGRFCLALANAFAGKLTLNETSHRSTDTTGTLLKGEMKQGGSSNETHQPKEVEKTAEDQPDTTEEESEAEDLFTGIAFTGPPVQRDSDLKSRMTILHTSRTTPSHPETLPHVEETPAEGKQSPTPKLSLSLKRLNERNGRKSRAKSKSKKVSPMHEAEEKTGEGENDTYQVPGMHSKKSIGLSPTKEELERKGLRRNDSMYNEIRTKGHTHGARLSLLGHSVRGVGMLWHCKHTLNIWSRRTVFKPENPKRMLWDMYMMLLILYYAFAVPVRIGFSLEPKHPLLEHFFTGCFALDILVNFNTALIGQGELLIVDRRLIAQDYFKAWFWIDFVATFPFEIVTGEHVHAHRMVGTCFAHLLTPPPRPPAAMVT